MARRSCRGALLVVDDQCKVRRRGVGRRARGRAVPAAGGGASRRGEPLLERAVPVVLDGEVRSPGELRGNDRPADLINMPSEVRSMSVIMEQASSD